MATHTSVVSLLAINGIDKAKQELAEVSTKFASGLNYARPSENVFAFVEAAVGDSTITYTDSALANLNRLRAILSTRTGALNVMLSATEELANIALQASGTLSDDVRASSEAVFAKVLSRVSDASTTANYNGIGLLDGSFGSAGTFAILGPVLNSVPVKAASAGALASLVDTYSNRTATLTFAAQPNAGDTLSIGSTTFTYVSTNTGAANTIMIGGSKEDSAINTLRVLNTTVNADADRFSYAIGTLNTVITVTELAVAPEALSAAVISSSSTGARVTQAYGGAVATIVNTETFSANGRGLLGQVGNLSFASQTSAGAANASLFRMYVDAIGYRTAPAAITTSANDLISKYTFNVGSTAYNGYMYNPVGNTAQAGIDDTMYCIKASDDTTTPGSGATATYAGKVFALKFQANKVTVSAANNSTFISQWNTDMANISFKQNNPMTLKNNGDITVGGVACGSTDGMAVYVQTANFTNLQVNSVKADATGITVVMNQNGTTKTFTTSSFQNQYLKGTSITLTESATSDTLTINVGKLNLELDTDAKRAAVSSALQNALQSNQASSFVVGSKVTQTLGVSLNSMKWSTLTSGAALTVADQTNAATASTTLSGIVNTLNKEIAQTAAYDKMVDSLIQQNKVSQQNLTSSIQQLVEIDISEVRNELDVALERITSCVAAIQAEKTSKTAVQQLLRI